MHPYIMDSVYSSWESKDDKKKDACLSSISKRDHKIRRRKAKELLGSKSFNQATTPSIEPFPDELIPPCPEDLKAS